MNMLGLPKIKEETFQRTLVLVSPLKNKNLYTGNEDIETVKLIQVCMRRQDVRRSKIVINSDDVFETLDEMSVSIKDYDLVSAKLRLFIRGQKRSTTVEIKPPGNTKLKKRKEKHLIEDYLREKGALLV